MNCVFADTWFYLAVLNPNDPNYPRALSVTRNERRHRVTTDWVLVEVGDALCRLLLEEGMHLYSYRRDKDWPLTDCMSFVVMEDEDIREALTGDRHFEQAGFVALLK